MKFKGKKIISFVLALILLFSSFSFVYAAEEPNIDEDINETNKVVFKKDQTVYVVLNSDGSVDQTIVMNRLFDYEGSELIDTGDYINIKAISQNIEPEIIDEQIIWNLKNDNKDFYYEGEVTSELPVIVELKYYLNGEELEAKELPGVTGELEINIKIKQNENTGRMHSNAYLTQIQIPIDLKKVEILDSPQAMQIVTGTVATISYSVMPDSDADYKLLLDVKNLEMDAMNISLISHDPMNEEQYQELTDGLIEMEDGVNELNKGTGKLRDGLAKLVNAIKELVDGIFSLSDGGDELQDGMNKYYEGLIEYRQGVDELTSGLGEVSSGLGTLYSQSSSIVGGYTQLYNGLSELQQGYEALITAIQQGGVNPGVSPPDLSGLTALLDNFGITDPATQGQIITEVGNVISAAVNSALSGGSADPDLTQLELIIDGLGLDAGVASNLLAELVSIINGAIADAIAEASSALDEWGARLAALGVPEEQIPGMLLELSTELAAGNDMDTILSLFSIINEKLKEILTGYSQANAGLRTYFSYMGELVAGIYEIESGMSKLQTATYDLTDAYSEMIVGSDKFFQGINETAEGSQELYDSVKSLPKDVDKITNGQKELKDGIVEMRKEFDKNYDADKVGRSFSFVTPEEEINSIQFIMLTPEIKIVKEEQAEPEDETEDLVWYEQIFKKVKSLLPFN